MSHHCLLLLAALVLASAPAAAQSDPTVDATRGFALSLGPDWTTVAADDAAAIDPAAAAMWRLTVDGTVYLAVESRRLPGLDVRLWAQRWAARTDERAARRFFARARRVFVVTSETIRGESMVIASEFHRSGGWVYRVSAYRALRASTELKTRLRAAARSFVMRPPAAERPPAPAGERRRWQRPTIAATLDTTGWLPIESSSRESILPDGCTVGIRDAVTGDQGALIVLGETASSAHLEARVRAFLATRFDPDRIRLLRRGDRFDGLFVGPVPDGRRMAELPTVWLARAWRVAGQGVLAIVGFVGFDLAEERARLGAFFDRIGDHDRWPTSADVTPRRGRATAPDARFSMRLVEPWRVDGGDRTMSPLELPGRPVLALVRGLDPRDPIRSAAWALVHTSHGRPPLFDGAVRDASGPARVVAGQEVAFDGTFTTGRDYTIWARDPVGGAWRIHARELRYAGGSATLLIGHPDDATDRLRAEVSAMRDAFRPHDSGAVDGVGGIALDGMRIDDGTWVDGLRGLSADVGDGWIWFDGAIADDLDRRATLCALRETSGVMLSFAARYAPGVDARTWAFSQRIPDVRDGRDGQLWVDTRTEHARFKSILVARRGWCARLTASLPHDAPPDAERAAYRVLRTFRSADAEVAAAAAGARAEPVESLIERDESIGIALVAPGGWRPAATPAWLPRTPIFAAHDPIHQRWLYAIESRANDGHRETGIAAEALLRALPDGRVTAAARLRDDAVVTEGTAAIVADGRGGPLPSHWVVRVFRAPRGTVTVLAGQFGSTLPDADRRALLEATEAVTAAP